MPAKARWWDLAVARYAEEKEANGEWSGKSRVSAGGDLRAWPARLERAGFPRPLHARDVSAQMVAAWKLHPVGTNGRDVLGTSPQSMMGNLRSFLRWAGNPVSEKAGVWKVGRGVPTRRRWYDRATIDRLFALAPDRLKPMLALMGWAGLRRAEAWGVRVRDVTLALDKPSVRVVRKGGDSAEIRIPMAALNAIRPAVVGRNPDDRLYPLAYWSLGRDLALVGAKLGIRVSPHDLRRSFGRILYYDFSVDINTIRALYGHKSAEMTTYYIGADSDRMAHALGHFDHPTTPPTPVETAEV